MRIEQTTNSKTKDKTRPGTGNTSREWRKGCKDTRSRGDGGELCRAQQDEGLERCRHHLPRSRWVLVIFLEPTRSRFGLAARFASSRALKGREGKAGEQVEGRGGEGRNLSESPSLAHTLIAAALRARRT